MLDGRKIKVKWIILYLKFYYLTGFFFKLFSFKHFAVILIEKIKFLFFYVCLLKISVFWCYVITKNHFKFNFYTVKLFHFLNVPGYLVVSTKLSKIMDIIFYFYCNKIILLIGLLLYRFLYENYKKLKNYCYLSLVTDGNSTLCCKFMYHIYKSRI